MIRLLCCLLLSISLFADKTTIERVEASLPQSYLPLLETLKESGFVTNGEDVDLQTLQLCFEHAIACQLSTKEIDHSIGAIHRLSPDTALCTAIDQAHLDLLLTVGSRPEVLQSYLDVGGIMLSIYPRMGLDLCSLAQQAIYCSNLQTYPHHLIDVPLAQSTLPTDLLGVTYLLTYPNGKQWLFSVQVDQNQEDTPLCIWYGPLHDVRILKRLCAVGQLLPVESLFTAD